MAETTTLYDASKLRAWREAAGLRREKVALDLDISAAWLGDVERGNPRTKPSLDLLHALARYYGHGAAELLDVPAAVA